MYLAFLLVELGFPCFRGFLGLRKEAGCCGQDTDAHPALGNAVEEGHPAPHGGIFWLGCPPGMGCCCSLPNPDRRPPKQLVFLPSQDGTAMLQRLRVKLVRCSVCTHVCTCLHTCPAHAPVASSHGSPFHFAATRLVCVLPEPQQRLLISSRSNFVSVDHLPTRVSSCFSLDQL